MSNKRRFSRIKCVEKCIVETANGPISVKLLDIALKGALVEHGSDLPANPGDRWKLLYQLDGSNIVLEFAAEVVHCRGDQTGVKFIEMDLDTMTHLRSLMEARTVNPEQVRYELELFLDDV
jgi:hypothetical protein